MANGVNGENILLALRRVELEVKQEPVPVIILSHLEEENNARAHQQKERNVVIFYHVEVLILLITL